MKPLGKQATDMHQALSRIELLPERFIVDCQWLYDRLREKRNTQLALLAEFNRRLAEGGEREISKSVLCRYAAKVRRGEIGRPEPVKTLMEGGGILTGVARQRLSQRLGRTSVHHLEVLLAGLATVEEEAHAETLVKDRV